MGQGLSRHRAPLLEPRKRWRFTTARRHRLGHGHALRRPPAPAAGTPGWAPATRRATAPPGVAPAPGPGPAAPAPAPPAAAPSPRRHILERHEHIANFYGLTRLDVNASDTTREWGRDLHR